MRILITNDDSISSSVLLPLARWAEKLGEVTVIVPKSEQSAKSHGIELHKSFEVKQIDFADGIRAYTVDSTPADCVRYAVLGLKGKFDFVISGINKGLNLGQDIAYSGTAAAVFEAAYLGIPAVALSTDPSSFEDALAELDRVREFFIQHDLFSKNNIYNVNIPLNPKEIRITRQGGPFYTDDFPFVEPDMVHPKGRFIYEDSHNDDLDTDAVMHGYISITPLTTSRTNLSVFETLSGLNSK